jgi:hypothetical protein
MIDRQYFIVNLSFSNYSCVVRFGYFFYSDGLTDVSTQTDRLNNFLHTQGGVLELLR